MNKTYSVSCASEQLDIKALYRDTGSKLILFIHGLGACKECFEHAFSFQTLDEYSLLSIDLPGFGDSTKSESFSYDMEDFAVIIKQILSHHEYKALHVVGHSMGGAIGILLSEKLDKPFDSFLCAEGNLIGNDCGLLSRGATRFTLPEFEKRGFKKMLSGCAGVKNTGMKTWLSWNQDAFVPGFFHSARSLVRWTDSGKLHKSFMKMKTRKAYVYGSNNSSMPVLADLVGIRKIPIPDGHHAMMFDNPEAFYSIVAEFISGQTPD